MSPPSRTSWICIVALLSTVPLDTNGLPSPALRSMQSTRYIRAPPCNIPKPRTWGDLTALKTSSQTTSMPTGLRGGEKTEKAEEDAMVLHYYSTWSKVYAHMSLDDGQTWTVQPSKVFSIGDIWPFAWSRTCIHATNFEKIILLLIFLKFSRLATFWI